MSGPGNSCRDCHNAEMEELLEDLNFCQIYPDALSVNTKISLSTATCKNVVIGFPVEFNCWVEASEIIGHHIDIR